MPEYPVTHRNDVSPEKTPHATKKDQESFNDPHNPENGPVPLQKGHNEMHDCPWIDDEKYTW